MLDPTFCGRHLLLNGIEICSILVKVMEGSCLILLKINHRVTLHRCQFRDYMITSPRRHKIDPHTTDMNVCQKKKWWNWDRAIFEMDEVLYLSHDWIWNVCYCLPVIPVLLYCMQNLREHQLSLVCLVVSFWLAGKDHLITYHWTVPLILVHSYLVGKLTSSKIADTKVSGF
jgi:hypothetical protein